MARLAKSRPPSNFTTRSIDFIKIRLIVVRPKHCCLSAERIVIRRRTHQLQGGGGRVGVRERRARGFGVEGRATFRSPCRRVGIAHPGGGKGVALDKQVQRESASQDHPQDILSFTVWAARPNQERSRGEGTNVRAWQEKVSVRMNQANLWADCRCGKV